MHARTDDVFRNFALYERFATKYSPSLALKYDIIISTRNTMESFLFPKHPASEITASEVTASKTPCKMEPGRSQML